MAFSADSSILGMIESVVPKEGWICKTFQYTCTDSGSGASWDALLDCTYSADQRESSVNYMCTQDSGWHGKCFVGQWDMLLSFNFRGEGYHLHAARAKRDNWGEPFTGFDYRGRRLVIKELKEFKWTNNEWILLE